MSSRTGVVNPELESTIVVSETGVRSGSTVMILVQSRPGGSYCPRKPTLVVIILLSEPYNLKTTSSFTSERMMANVRWDRSCGSQSPPKKEQNKVLI